MAIPASIPPPKPESKAQLAGHIGRDVQAQAKKIFSDLIGATVGVISINIALATSGKTQTTAFKTYQQSMTWRESLMKKDAISPKKPLTMRDTAIKRNIAKLAGSVSQDIKARFDCARQAIMKNKSVAQSEAQNEVQSEPQHASEEPVAASPKRAKERPNKPLPPTPSPRQPVQASPQPVAVKLRPDDKPAPRRPVADLPAPLEIQKPPAKTKPASAEEAFEQALQQAQGVELKDAEQLQTIFEKLTTQMREAADKLDKRHDPGVSAHRYQKSAQFLMHVASKYMNTPLDTSAVRTYLLQQVDGLEYNCVLKNVDISPAIKQQFDAIRDKVALRKPTEPPFLPMPGDVEEDQPVVMPSIGLRTRAMNTWLDRQFTRKNYRNELLYLDNRPFVPLSGQITDFLSMPTASIGSSPTREILTLDPENSPELNRHYHLLEQAIRKESEAKRRPLNPEEMLTLVNSYVREKIFPTCNDRNLERQVDAFVDAKRPTQTSVETKTSKKIPVIPIDDFIVAGTGVCRHHALVTAYLLDRLSKEQGGKTVPEGTVKHVRDNLDGGGAHVWVNFICDAGKFHLDTLWNVVTPFNQPEEHMRLGVMYGPVVMANQERRANRVVENRKAA